MKPEEVQAEIADLEWPRPEIVDRINGTVIWSDAEMVDRYLTDTYCYTYGVNRPTKDFLDFLSSGMAVNAAEFKQAIRIDERTLRANGILRRRPDRPFKVSISKDTGLLEISSPSTLSAVIGKEDAENYAREVGYHALIRFSCDQTRWVPDYYSEPEPEANWRKTVQLFTSTERTVNENVLFGLTAILNTDLPRFYAISHYLLSEQLQEAFPEECQKLAAYHHQRIQSTLLKDLPGYVRSQLRILTEGLEECYESLRA